jgi:predicted hotdog family 3-hydroxylacyl-ACP dehydratase
VKPCPYPLDRTLPHAYPMILLDSITGVADDALEAIVAIGRDKPFFRAGGMPAHVAIEYMAQACGAFVGVEALARGGTPRIGLLLGSRNFAADRQWFHAGETLRVRVEVVFREGNMGVFDCRIAGDAGDEPLATARLTVYQPADGENMEAVGG